MLLCNQKQTGMKKFKYLELIILLNVTLMAVVNVISGKIVHLGFFTLSAASLCIPLNYLIGDTLTEVYGYQQARRATWILIFATVIMAVLFQLAIYLPPAPGFTNNEAYTTVLSQVPRIVIGSWIALFAGQFVNDFVLAKMKVLTKGKYLWSRTMSSTLVGQAVDTTSFYTIALYNVIPSGLLVKSILSAWFLKVLIEILMTPATYFVVRKLKRAEAVDHFDTKTNFNPFMFQLRK